MLADAAWSDYVLVGQPVSQERVDLFQSRFGIVLPENYLQFLWARQGQTVKNGWIDVAGRPQPFGCVLGFIDDVGPRLPQQAYVVPWNLAMLVGKGYPTGLVPIIASSVGLVALDFTSDRQTAHPAVVYVYAQYLGGGPEESVTPLAASFEDFLANCAHSS